MTAPIPPGSAVVAMVREHGPTMTDRGPWSVGPVHAIVGRLILAGREWPTGYREPETVWELWPVDRDGRAIESPVTAPLSADLRSAAQSFTAVWIDR